MTEVPVACHSAWVVEHLSPDFSGLALRLVPTVAPGPGQVQVRVRAAALNFPDVLMTQGGYQFKPELPFVPGMEAAGEVLAVGHGVSQVSPGDAVVVNARQGALAECMTVAASQLRPMPAGLDWAVAASYSVTGLTAYVALIERARLQAGETLLVHGASGGTGMAAVQLGRHLGARVIATGRSLDKLEAVRAAGADACIALGPQLRDEVMRLTQGQGVDVVFDPVGGEVFETSLRTLGWGGRLLVIGFLAGHAASVRSNYVLIKGLSVMGVRAGEQTRRHPERGAQMRAEVDALAAQGVLRPPISHRFPLDQGRQALEAMARGEAVGKMVVLM